MSATMVGDPLRKHGFDKGRLEALVDGIFAVALTLLILDIKMPEGVVFANDQELWQRLVLLERHLAIYIVTFIVIGMYWIGHHVQFQIVRYVDRTMIWINMAHMLLISFLPFATDLIGDHPELVLPCEIYGLALMATSAMGYLNLRYLSAHPNLAAPELTPDIVRMIARRIGILTLVPLISMAAAFYSTKLSIYVYLLLVAFHFFRARVDDVVHREDRNALESSEKP